MSTQIEVKEPIKLLNKDGSLTQPGWARRNIIEYNREDIRASKWTVKEWDFYQVGCKDFIVQLIQYFAGVCRDNRLRQPENRRSRQRPDSGPCDGKQIPRQQERRRTVYV